MISKSENNNPGKDESKLIAWLKLRPSKIRYKPKTKRSKYTKKPTNKEKEQRFLILCKKYKTVIQFVGIFFGLITLGAYIWVSCDQAKKTRESLDIANKSFAIARASDSTDCIMRIKDTLAKDRNTKLELRAYLVVDEIRLDSIKNKFIQFSVKITNTGKTPAYCIMASANIKPDGSGIYENEMAELLNVKPDTNTLTRGNGMDMILNFPQMYWECKKTTINYILTGGLGVWAYGIIYYSDVFKNKHKTKFCYFMILSPQGLWQSTAYKYYNDGD